MTPQKTDRRALFYFAAILVIYVGALSPVWVAGNLHPKLAGLARGGLSFLGLVLLLLELAIRGRIRFPVMAAFGLMPWVYLVCTAFVHSQLEGAYVYLYKFAPYLCAGVLWLLLRRVSDRAFFWTVLALGAFISLRALFVFLAPSLNPQRGGLAEAADAFFVYEWIGGLPRVFYPGTPLVFLGVLLAVRGCTRFDGREQWACFAYCFIGLAALLVTMTRGMLLVGAIVLIVQAVWCIVDSKADWRKRLNLVTGMLLLLGALTAVALVSGYGDALLKRFADVGSSDRMTLDDRNMRWREDQADAAFSMMQNSADWIVGMGPTATVPLSHGTMNELHFGYHSVLWTFGLVGLSLLVLALLHIVAGAFFGSRQRAYTREAALATVFMAVTGAYTGVFTVPDCAIVLALAAAYLWLPRFAGAPARGEQPSPQVAEPGWALSEAPPAKRKSRRWSAQVRRGHATP